MTTLCPTENLPPESTRHGSLWQRLRNTCNVAFLKRSIVNLRSVRDMVINADSQTYKDNAILATPSS